MAITQTSDKASINWQSFNVGTGASVNIAQPSTSAILLNRVVGNDPSQILGKLSANGQVILLNPNGILFGKDGSVTASTFTASTFGLSDADFMSGYYKYNRNGSTATIVNEGTIETTAGGFVALIGASVSNDGKIIAHQGNVVLAAAESVTLPDSMALAHPPSTTGISIPLSKKVRLELLPASVNAAIENTPNGVIVTEGGQVLLQAAAISSAVASIMHSGSIDTSGAQGGAVQVLAENGKIKIDGSIKANSSGNDSHDQALKGGDIIIGRDEENGALSKTTDVSGATLQSQGGLIETSGHQLSVSDAKIKAGNWLLDPYDIEITDAANALTAGYTTKVTTETLQTALNAGTAVTIQTTGATSGVAFDITGTNSGSGNILVSSTISKTSNTSAGGATPDASLTLNADKDITFNASVVSSSGKLNLRTNLASSLAVNTMSINSNITTNGGNFIATTGSRGVINATSASINSGTGYISMSNAGAASINAITGEITTGGLTNYAGSGITLSNTALSGSYVNLLGSNSGSSYANAINIFGASSSINATNNVIVTGSVISFGSTGVILNAPITAGGSATLSASSGSTGTASITSNSGGTISAAGGTTINVSGLAGILNGVIDGGSSHSGGLTVNANGYNSTVKLTGANLYTGTTTITTGALQLGTGGATGSLSATDISIASNASLIFSRNNSYTFNNTISGAGAISQAGTGTIILTATNNYSGATNIYSGTLQVGNAGSGATTSASIGTGSVTLDGLNSTLSYKNGDGTIISNTISGNGIITADGDLTLNGALTINPSSATNSIFSITNTAATASNATSTGNITLASAATKTSTTAGTLNVTAINGIIQNNGISASGTAKLDVNLTANGLTYGVASSSLSAAQRALSRGLFLNGISVNTNGGDINLIGTSYANASTSGNANASAINAIGKGIQIHNQTSITANNINITGVSDTQASQTGIGVLFQRYPSAVKFTASGNISITGTTQGTGSGNAVLFERSGWGAQAPIFNSTGSFTLRGNNRASTSNTSASISSPSGFQVKATGNISVLAETNNAAVNAIDFSSNAAGTWGTSLYGNVSLKSVNSSGTASGNVLIQSNQGGIYFNNQLPSNLTSGSLTSINDITGINITIDNSGAGMTTGTGNTVGSGSIDAITGVITKGSGKSNSANSGININDDRSITASNNINIVGIGTTGSGVTIAGAATLSANIAGYTGNINIAGENTSTNGAAINISNASSSITSLNYTTLISSGTGSGTSLVANGNITIGGELQVTNPASGSIAGIIAGNGMLRKIGGTGAGTLSLTGTNTYTGGTTANGGVLQVGNGGLSGTLGVGGLISVGSALWFNRSDALTVSQNIGGTGTVRQTGTGTTTLTGTNNYSGTTSISAGALQIGSGGTTGTLGSGAVVNDASLIFNRDTSADLIFANAISGTGSLTQSGAGKTILTGTNVYQGTTTISAGTLQIGNGGTTGTLGTNAVSIAGNSNLSVYRSDSLNVTNTLSGLGSINFLGTGTQGQSDYQLTGNNTSFNGNINLTLSRLGITAANRLGTAAITVNSGAGLYLNGNFTVNNALSLAGNGWNETPWGYLGALRLSSSANYGGAITLAANSRIGAHNSTGTVSGVISGSKNLEFNTPSDTYSSVIYLTNSNTYTGNTTINSGTLQLGTGGTTGDVAFSSAIADNGTLIINHSNAVSLSQNITGTGGLTQAGSGTTTLTGTNAYDVTTISAGTLQVGNGGNSGSLGSGNIVDNATLVFNRDTSSDLTVANAISGTGTLTQSGAGKTILTGTNSYQGTTTISAGTLQIGNGGTTGTLGSSSVVDNAALVFNRDASSDVTVANAISGTGTLAQSGAGKTILTGTNSYQGTTTISAGTLQIGNGGTTGTLGSGSVIDNAALVFNRDASSDITVAGAISGNGSLTQSGTGKTILSGNNSYTGTTTVSAGTLGFSLGNFSESLTGNFVNNSAVTFTANANTSALGTLFLSGSGTTSGTGTWTIDAASAPTSMWTNRLDFRGATTTSGAITANNYGNFWIDGSSNSTSAVNLNGANTKLYVYGSASKAIGTLTGTGQVGFGDAAGGSATTLSLGNDNGTGAFTGSINNTAGTLSITKAGSGTQTLAGNNNYSGTTAISGGTLQIGNGGANGDLGNTTGVTLSNNANLTFNKNVNTSINKAISGNGNVSANITGDLTLTSDIALTGTNTINLAASNAITESMGSLTATNLYMTATGSGIGATGNRIQSNVNNLSFSAGGNVFITEANAVTAAGRTTANNGNIDLATTNGTLSINAVNSISGMTTNGSGNITLTGYTSTGHGISINNNITATNGDVSLTGTTTSTTNPNAGVYSSGTVSAKNITMLASATAISGAQLGYYGAGGIFVSSQQLNLTGTSSSSGNGLYAYSGRLSSGTGMTLVGSSTSGQAMGLEAGVTITNGSAGGISMTGTATDGTKQAIGLRGVAITNGGANLSITANNGVIYTDAGVPAWGASQTNTIINSGTGAIQISAGNGNANNSGSIDGSVFNITQNANAGVLISTSGAGNVTVPKITNSGTGDIVVAAGVTLAAGTATGGQILTIANNTLTHTNVTPGKTYIYSGSANATGALSNLNNGFNTLYYEGTSQAINTGFNTGFDSNHANDLIAPTGGSVSNTQVFFRSTTKPGFSMTLANSNKAYGDNDPTLNATNGITLTNTYTGAGGNNTFAVTTADVLAGLTGTRAAGENVGNYAYALDGSNFNTTLTTQPTLTIDKRDITLATIVASNKIYNGTTAATIASATFNNLSNGESLELNGNGNFSDKNAASGKTVTVTDVTNLTKTDGTGSWNNYRLITTGSKTTTADIAKAALSVSATAVTKTYDGGLSATGTATVGSLASANDSISNAGTQAFVDKNVGTGKTVTASGVTIKDAANADMTGNYAITYVDNTSSVINKAPLLISANADARFVTQPDASGYNGVSYSGFVGGETNAALSGALSISRTNALTDLAAANYSGVLVPTGLTSSNYDIRYINGNYTIVPADRLLVKTANQTVTYGTTPSYATTAQYLDSHDNQIKVLTQTGSNNNYTFDDGAGTTINLAFKPYTGTNVAAQSTSGNTVVGIYDVKDLAYSQTGTNFNGTPVFTGVLSVNQKAITPTAGSVSKVYDGTTSMNNVVVGMNGKVSNDLVAISSTGAFTQKNVGANLGYTITGISLSAADAGNYYLSGGNAISGNDGVITASPLIITTSNVTKVYDRTTAAAGVAQVATGSQTFGSDSLSGGTFAFTSASAGAANKTVTVSDVTINDGNNGNNYVVSYVNNTTSTITPKALTASMSAANKTYDGATTASVTGNSSDIILGDTVAFANTGATFSEKNVGTSKTVSVTGISITGGDASNYNLQNTSATTTADIAKAALSVSATAVTKTYDGGLSATGTATVGSLASANDSISNAGTQAFVDKNVGTGKTVTASGVTIKDAANADMTGNYAITYVDNTSSVINKAPLLISANADARFVTQPDASGYNGVSYSGFVGGETNAALSGALSISRTNALTDLAAANYSGVLVPTGLTSSNYDIRYINGNYTIVPADRLLVKTANQTVTYGTTPSYATTAQYLDSHDNQIKVLTQTGSNNNYTFDDGAGTTINLAFKPYTGTNVAAQSTSGNTVVGIYDVKDLAYSQTGTNFNGTPVFTGVLSVNQKAITPTAGSVSKVYDGTTSMNNVVVGMNGKVSNDLVAISSTGAFTQKNVGANLGYTITGISLSAADAGNYYLSDGINQLSGLNGAITPAPLVLSAYNLSKVYDGTVNAIGTLKISEGTQMFGTDFVSGGIFTFASPTVGINNKVVHVSDAVISDGNNGQNYAITYIDNTQSSITSPKVPIALPTLTIPNRDTAAPNGNSTLSSSATYRDATTPNKEVLENCKPDASSECICILESNGGTDSGISCTSNTQSVEIKSSQIPQS